MAVIRGVIQQWNKEGVRESKYSFNIACRIGESWYNFYDKDRRMLEQYLIDFPQGSEVEIDFDESKGYKPVNTIRMLTGAEAFEQASTIFPPDRELPLISDMLKHLVVETNKAINYLDTYVREHALKEYLKNDRELPPRRRRE